MKLFGTMKTVDNEINIGGCSVSNIAKKFGTPLYIVDEVHFKKTIDEFKNNFTSSRFETNVIYASKAMLNIYTARLVKDKGLSLDVVSGGEIYTGLKAGFPPERMYFHGNNKLEKELRLAIENNIGTIIIDNDLEVEILSDLLKEYGKNQKVLLRVNPGIDAHTHEYIKTSKNDSKFGVSIYDENSIHLIQRMEKDPHLIFRGLHCHIGSQIFDENSFFKGSETMLDYIETLQLNHGISCKELNLGGGFGVYYTEEDQPFKLGEFLRKLALYLEDYIHDHKLLIEKVDIEPGRALINNSGSTLYTVGGVKETFGGKKYIFIDGGMTDNIRPALYQAKYEACIATKVEGEEKDTFTIAGKCCESGDILIKDIELPLPERGDLLLINSTGAYNYSMSSNYNRIERPAMVFIEEGKAKLAVRREEYNDLISHDLINIE